MIKSEIIKILKEVGVKSEIELSKPPDSRMGDLALACFELAKNPPAGGGKNPAKVAEELVSAILTRRLAGKDLNSSVPSQNDSDFVLNNVKAFGPYVNFYINPKYLAEQILSTQNSELRTQNSRIMVEFACPNTHKAFHIGHLRNITTGESIVRILEAVGHQVIRVNYQGDVGMHIAKCLYGIKEKYGEQIYKHENDSPEQKAKLLGEVYAYGSQEFEDNEMARQEVIEFNDKIYSQDKSIKKLYKTTRRWSLEYFDSVYKRVGSHFDRFYFESEVFDSGIKLVKKFLKKQIFELGEGGAVIFPGSKYGLHERVFINSKGFPTYEAKEMALGKLQFKEYKPGKILHVVAKEQTEYFKVAFKALESVVPNSKGREFHLVYGWVDLKTGKMSSRTGKVVLGEWLLDSVKNEVKKLMSKNDKEKVDEATAEKIAIAAVKYSFLKTGIKNDIKFDLEESVSLSGDSGPYLLYIVARIKSILEKNINQNLELRIENLEVQAEEKMLLFKLSEFDEVVQRAAENYDPSQIAKYLFDLAQSFNSFYEHCPVLKAKDEEKSFRLALIRKIATVMEKGLYLLGIESVERM